MAGSRTTNTFSEELNRLIQTVAAMRLLPDADLPFVMKLEDLLTTRGRMPEQQMAQAGLIPTPQANPMGNAQLGLPAPPMGGMGMSVPPSPMLGSAAVPGPPGVMSPGPGPSGDDLAMLLGAGV